MRRLGIVAVGAVSTLLVVLVIACGKSGSRAFDSGTREYYVFHLLHSSLPAYGHVAGEYLQDDGDAFLLGWMEQSVWSSCQDAERLEDSRDRDIFLEACRKWEALRDSVGAAGWREPVDVHPWQDTLNILDEMNDALLSD